MKRDAQRPLPHLHRAADARRGRQVRDPPEDGGRLGRHQPDLPPGRPDRVRDQRDVHGDGHARRRVRARARGAAARDDHASTAATPTGTSSRRTSRTPSRRSSATTARIGFSQWEHFGPVNDVKLRAVNPDGTQHGRRRAASTASPSNALFTRPARLSPNVMIGIGTARDRTIHAGALVQIDARNHARPGLHRRQRTTPTAARSAHACLDEEHATFTVLTPERPDRQRPVARRPLPRAERPARRPHPHLVGRRPGQRPERAVADAAGLRHLHLRPDDAARTSSSTTTGRRGTSTRSPSCRAPSRRSSAATQHVQDSTIPVRIGSVNVAETEPERDRVSGAQFNNTPLGAGAQAGRRRGPRHRGLLERGGQGRHDVRPHDVRGRRRPRRGAGLHRTAAGSRTCRRTSRSTCSRSTSSASRSATSSSGSRACRARIAAASVATSRAPARACPAFGQNPTVAEQARHRGTNFTEADRRTAPSTPGTRRCSRSSTRSA